MKTNGYLYAMVGMRVKYRTNFGKGNSVVATIERIELCKDEHCKDGMEVSEVLASELHRCCIDLDNGFWAYGYQVEELIG